MNKTSFIFTLLLGLGLCGQVSAQLPANPWKPVPKQQQAEPVQAPKVKIAKAKTNAAQPQSPNLGGLPANPWKKPQPSSNKQ